MHLFGDFQGFYLKITLRRTPRKSAVPLLTQPGQDPRTQQSLVVGTAPGPTATISSALV